jgi:hypothetical protein
MEEVRRVNFDEEIVARIVEGVKLMARELDEEVVVEACWRIVSEHTENMEEKSSVLTLPYTDIVSGLRLLARNVESGQLEVADSLTWIYGHAVGNLGYFGNDVGTPARNAIYDMNFGIHKLIDGAFQGGKDE